MIDARLRMRWTPDGMRYSPDGCWVYVQSVADNIATSDARLAALETEMAACREMIKSMEDGK